MVKGGFRLWEQDLLRNFNFRKNISMFKSPEVKLGAALKLQSIFSISFDI